MDKNQRIIMLKVSNEKDLPNNFKCEVQFYASELNITAKYLNAVCKQNSGVTASEWIQ